jgi:hypothetical protein
MLMEQEQNNAEKVEIPTPDEAWRRFTLLDLLILFSGHEAALGLMKWYGMLDEKKMLAGPSVAPIIFPAFLVMVLGGLLSVPIVLLVQFQFRKRRQLPRGGEIYAVGHSLFWTSLFGAWLITPDRPYALVPFVAIYLLCSPIFAYGACRFLVCILLTDKKAPCKWLGLYGYFLSFIYIAFFLLSVSVRS